MLKPFFLMLAIGGFTVSSVLAQDPMGNNTYDVPEMSVDIDNSIMPEGQEKIIERSSEVDDSPSFDDVTLDEFDTEPANDKPQIVLAPEEYIENNNVDETPQIVVQN